MAFLLQKTKIKKMPESQSRHVSSSCLTILAWQKLNQLMSRNIFPAFLMLF